LQGRRSRSGLPSWATVYDAAKSELMVFAGAAAIVQADPWKLRLDLIERAVEGQTARPQ
jgi:hypothetical protein